MIQSTVVDGMWDPLQKFTSALPKGHWLKRLLHLSTATWLMDAAGHRGKGQQSFYSRKQQGADCGADAFRDSSSGDLSPGFFEDPNEEDSGKEAWNDIAHPFPELKMRLKVSTWKLVS